MTRQHGEYYYIDEIFYSLQGEGAWVGTPAVFVRFSGCNLRCSWCDTPVSRQATTAYTLDTLLREIQAAVPFPMSLTALRIILTGGEPCLQLDDTLVYWLHTIGGILHVETNGTQRIPEGVDWVTVSPKSAYADQWHVFCGDELKIVWDGTPWFESSLSRTTFTHYFLQPQSEADPVASGLIDYIKEHPLWRLSLQTHKMIKIP